VNLFWCSGFVSKKFGRLELTISYKFIIIEWALISHQMAKHLNECDGRFVVTKSTGFKSSSPYWNTNIPSDISVSNWYPYKPTMMHFLILGSCICVFSTIWVFDAATNQFHPSILVKLSNRDMPLTPKRHVFPRRTHNQLAIHQIRR